MRDVAGMFVEPGVMRIVAAAYAATGLVTSGRRQNLASSGGRGAFDRVRRALAEQSIKSH
jgi:hypothetical protein